MEYSYFKDNDNGIVIGYDHFSWAFFLMVDQVPNLEEWKKKFQEPNSEILDEDSNVISPEDMEMIITMRVGNYNCTDANIRVHGYNVFKGTHDLTHTNPSCAVGGIMCIANEDCWDLCIYP